VSVGEPAAVYEPAVSADEAATRLGGFRSAVDLALGGAGP
jgi:hypothetical protein